MESRKIRARNFFSREDGVFRKQEYWSTAIYIYVHDVATRKCTRFVGCHGLIGGPGAVLHGALPSPQRVQPQRGLHAPWPFGGQGGWVARTPEIQRGQTCRSYARYGPKMSPEMASRFQDMGKLGGPLALLARLWPS